MNGFAANNFANCKYSSLEEIKVAEHFSIALSSVTAVVGFHQ